MVVKWLSELLLGSVLKPVINGLLTAQKQKLDAADNREERLKTILLQAELNDLTEAELNNKLNIIEAGGKWYQRFPRALMGGSAAVLVAKLLVWDLALGEWTRGHTDPLSDQAFWVLTTVIISYAGGRTIDKGINVLALAFGKKS